MKIKRNYRPLQVFLDFFALFLLYVFFYSFIRGFIIEVLNYNYYIKAAGAEHLRLNPYPVIVWAVIAVIVCAVSAVLPFVFAKRTKFSQKQYDLWVYAVLLIRIVLLVMLMSLMGEHMHKIYEPVESNPLSVLIGAVLIIIIVRITVHRIKLLTPAKKRRGIVED